jgi:addiction module HigA family antidote
METTMMKNPPHPGQGLKDEIETLGLSVAQFAKALGVTRQQLYRVINGDCGITPEMAMRLEMVVGSSADFWLRLQMNYDLAQIRNRASQFKLKKLARPEVA